MFRTYAPIEVTSYHLPRSNPRFEVTVRLNYGSITTAGSKLSEALHLLADQLNKQLQEPNLVVETEYSNRDRI